MPNNNKKKTLIQIFVLIGFLYIFVFSHVMIVFDVVEDDYELYELTTKAIKHNKSYIKFKSEECPDDLDYLDILDEAMESDMYSAGEFYEYKYQYKEDSDGIYHVTLKINKPRLHRKLFAKARAKKIAKCYSGLGSDYEKVKAVHDYIITYNTYSSAMGGAYRTLCSGYSACNGYALAFYEIMTELGIPVTNEAGGNHMWNSVYVDGNWYNIDLTWDDPGDGSVHYDYFLKCDADWVGHAYGASDAKTSLPVTGKSAREYYKMVPNHKITRVIMYFILAIIGAAVIYLVLVYIPKKKAAFKRKQEELLEKTLRQNQELMRFENELEHRDDY